MAEERELLATARKVASLQTQARKLRKELKRVEGELKIERRHLRVLASDRAFDAIPSRVFGEGVGVRVKLEPKEPKKSISIAKEEDLGF